MAVAILSRAREARAPSPSLEVPAMIAGDVNLLKFSEALARAGLVGRHDAERGILVIEPAPARCVPCAGTGLEEDSRCAFCGGTGREGASGTAVIHA